MSAPTTAEPIIELIRSRRVVREFTVEPVSENEIRVILEAGRWAATGGNRRIHRFLVVRSPARIRLVKAVSPGIWASPMALIVICVDMDLVRADQVQIDKDSTVLIDVGTAAQNMMLAAHALGVGSCPATSFSRSGLIRVLDLAPNAVPEFILQLGRPLPQRQRSRIGPRVTVDDLTYWERYPRQSDESERTG
jgi:nitroreductase